MFSAKMNVMQSDLLAADPSSVRSDLVLMQDIRELTRIDGLNACVVPLVQLVAGLQCALVRFAGHQGPRS
jgi:hypothetical protein